ncbi:MAG: polysaccharide deacetylase family protein [Candidatus Omnitrophota bacterium]
MNPVRNIYSSKDLEKISNGVKKKIIIISAAVIVFIAGAVFFYKMGYVVPVLMYHSIDYNDRVTKLSLSPESFRRQMEFLHKRRYNVLPLEKIIPYIEKKKKVPPGTVAITFDDGYYNNYKYAYPVLKKYNLPATIFVIVNKVGAPGYLNWKEIKEMSDSGIITIGSHTMNHLWLPDVAPRVLEKEVKESKEILEKRLGKDVKLFCYPIGAHDKKVEKAVEDAGYACAVATNPGRFKPTDDIYAIKRVRISRTSDNMFVFWVETSGIYTWIKEHRDE